MGKVNGLVEVPVTTCSLYRMCLAVYFVPGTEHLLYMLSETSCRLFVGLLRCFCVTCMFVSHESGTSCPHIYPAKQLNYVQNHQSNNPRTVNEPPTQLHHPTSQTGPAGGKMFHYLEGPPPVAALAWGLLLTPS